jgi:hypothetical protein
MSILCVDFAQKLASLGLGHYYGLLKSNSFVSWESVQRITEIDMEKLQIKRGSRRKLLRAIATDKGYPTTQALKDTSISKECSTTNSASKDQWTGLRQYSLGRNTISPTPLQAEYSTSINCSDPVRSEYY